MLISVNTQLGPQLLCLVGATHLRIQRRSAQVERALSWASRGRRNEASRGTPHRLRLLSLTLRLGLGLGDELSLILLGLQILMDVSSVS